MPPDPNDKMEELLKACAQKRREQSGAPFALHPATRQMLQAEVARLVPSTAAKGGKTPFLFRFLFTVAAAASIAICAVILSKPAPEPKYISIASHTPAPFDNPLDQELPNVAISAPAPVLPSAPGGAPMAVPPDLATATPLAATFREADPADDAYILEKEMPEERSANKDMTRADGAASLKKSEITITPSVPGGGPATNDTRDAASLLSNSLNGADISLNAPQSRFGMDDKSKEADAVSEKPTTPEVQAQQMAVVGILTTFQFELEGDNVRLIDADGSTYTGKMTQPFQQKQIAISNGQTFTNISPVNQHAVAIRLQHQNVMKNPQKSSAGVTAGVSNSSQNVSQTVRQNYQAQQNFFFRASGISRRFNKPVTFEGNYIAANGQQDLQNEMPQAKSSEPLREKAAAAAPQVENNARIQGEVQIGNSGKIDIDAIVVPMKTKAGN